MVAPAHDGNDHAAGVRIRRQPRRYQQKRPLTQETNGHIHDRLRLREAREKNLNLVEGIKNLGNWWHWLEATYLVKSDLTAVEIRDVLKGHLASTDKLLIAKLSGSAAWVGFSDQSAEWLKTTL